MSQNNQSSVTTNTSTPNTGTEKSEKQKPAPAYLALVTAIKEACDDLGVPVNMFERKNFIGFESTVNGHKLYVPKHAGTVGWCETSVALPRGEQVRDLPKGPGSNGKIDCQIAPDFLLITDSVLPLFAASEDKIRANKKPARRSTVTAATEATPAAAAAPAADFHMGSGLEAE